MPDAQNQHSTQDAVDRARRLLAVEDGHLEYDPLVIEDAQALVNLYEQYENLVALRDDLTLKAYERGQEVERLKEQLEAFQELAQDASDITQVGHGLELDVPGEGRHHRATVGEHRQGTRARRRVPDPRARRTRRGGRAPLRPAPGRPRPRRGVAAHRLVRARRREGWSRRMTLPEWIVLALLGAVYVGSALPRRQHVGAGAEDPVKPPSRAEASGSQ